MINYSYYCRELILFSRCVNFVLQYVDTDVLVQLVPRLVDIIKGNPSIVTRAGAAHVVVTLTHQVK